MISCFCADICRIAIVSAGYRASTGECEYECERLPRHLTNQLVNPTSSGLVDEYNSHPAVLETLRALSVTHLCEPLINKPILLYIHNPIMVRNAICWHASDDWNLAGMLTPQPMHGLNTT
jgi:hypothetical protein